MSEGDPYLHVMGAAVMSLSTDVIYIIDADSLRLIQVNRAFTRVFGYSNEEAKELVLYQLTVAGRAKVDAVLAQLATSGELILGTRPYRCKDGGVVDMETRVGRTVVDGRPLLCVVSRDQTQIRRAEQAVRDSEQRFRTLAEAAFEAIGITEHGIIVDGNPQLGALLRIPLAEMIGKPVVSFVAPEWRDRIADRMRADAGDPIEHVLSRPDGTEVAVEAQAKSLTVDGRRVRVTALRDISQRKRLEEQLRLAQRMESVGRLAGGVAHDFNNVLTVIISLVKLLVDAPRPKPELDDLLQIKAAADRGAELTRQLLAFARRQIVEPQVIDLNRLVDGVDKMLRRILGEHIELQTVCQPELGAVRADPGQIEQVVMNLAINARDAMASGGKLTIETANVLLGEEYVATHADVRPGEHVMIGVSDTGAGMDAATLERVFEPFFTTKAATEGSGLGLSTCYGIVKQSGGSIWVYSELGRGTTFKVYFPRVYEAASVPEPRVSAASHGGSETLLVVEDDAMVRRVAVRILMGQGYRVHAAADPAEALALFEQLGGAIDLVVTDVVLPQMSGKDLTDELRRRKPGLKVLYTSGYTENTIVHQGVVDDGVSFLAKPYMPADLARRVREVIDRG